MLSEELLSTINLTCHSYINIYLKVNAYCLLFYCNFGSVFLVSIRKGGHHLMMAAVDSSPLSLPRVIGRVKL